MPISALWFFHSARVTFCQIRQKTAGTQPMGTGIDNSPSWLSRIVFGRNPKRTAVLLKRVIGLPGETIAVEQGIVRINGEPLEELYVKNQKAPWQIPEQTLAND